MDNEQATAKARYTHLEGKRSASLNVGRDCAKLTIPSLLPEDESDSRDYPTPVNGIGSKGVVHLASKLLMALFPSNGAWFRFGLDEEAEVLLEKENVKEDALQDLAKVERKILRFDESRNSRSAKNEILKHLIVAGNVAKHTDKNGDVRVFPLNCYVVNRSPSGELIELIIKEKVSYQALPEITQLLIQEDHKSNSSLDDTVEVYTSVTLVKGKYEVFQEVFGKRVPNSDGSYKKDELPYQALRWNTTPNSAYGIGHIEIHLGDLRSLEAIRECILDFNAAASKVVFLLKEGSSVKLKQLREAKAGDVLRGNADDVTVLQLEKYSDFKVLSETAAEIYRSLAHAFLLNSSVQRDAERVTAEEVRIVARELEDALGGVYSLLAQEWQLPYLRRLMMITKASKDLPKDLVSPTIIAGMAALSRGHEDAKLSELILEFAQMGIEPDEVFNMDVLAQRKVNAKGIETDGLVKTKDQMLQDKQQKQMAEMVANSAPTVAGNLTKGN